MPSQAEGGPTPAHPWLSFAKLGLEVTGIGWFACDLIALGWFWTNWARHKRRNAFFERSMFHWCVIQNFRVAPNLFPYFLGGSRNPNPRLSVASDCFPRPRPGLPPPGICAEYGTMKEISGIGYEELRTRIEAFESGRKNGTLPPQSGDHTYMRRPPCVAGSVAAILSHNLPGVLSKAHTSIFCSRRRLKKQMAPNQPCLSHGLGLNCSVVASPVSSGRSLHLLGRSSRFSDPASVARSVPPSAGVVDIQWYTLVTIICFKRNFSLDSEMHEREHISRFSKEESQPEAYLYLQPRAFIQTRTTLFRTRTDYAPRTKYDARRLLPAASRTPSGVIVPTLDERNGGAGSRSCTRPGPGTHACINGTRTIGGVHVVQVFQCVCGVLPVGVGSLFPRDRFIPSSASQRSISSGQLEDSGAAMYEVTTSTPIFPLSVPAISFGLS
ncbi:hypothetical protein FB45DRAFT_875984 [Roridomyces roridus]|uniref:Uncharacterized protein n=1 Tax=Roridomyces roridus TaxID=1738132 RepID=A0AAD7B519_9AGAR|nr:hypothetical protein FB45DRAFT_875984 [Roridomyces roridus]